MSLSMAACQRRLGVVWLLLGGGVFLLVAYQSIRGHYGYDEIGKKVWEWLLPLIAPNLGLIIAVLAADAVGAPAREAQVKGLFFGITMGLSIVYLALVWMIVVLNNDPRQMVSVMSQSSVWLGTFQGFVTGALGAFFAKGGKR